MLKCYVNYIMLTLETRRQIGTHSTRYGVLFPYLSNICQTQLHSPLVSEKVGFPVSCPPVCANRRRPPRRSALLRVYHSAPAQPSAPAAQILPRSTQARPMHTFSHTTASISSAPHKNLPCIRLHERMPGEVFLCCFLFPYLISGSKLGFSSFSAFSAGASTVLGSSAFAGSSSFFSSFLTKEDFLPFCAAAASIDSVD